MKKAKRMPTTLYLDPAINRAIKMKAVLSGRSMSDMVNDALAYRLKRRREDLKVMRAGEREPVRRYENFLKDLETEGFGPKGRSLAELPAILKSLPRLTPEDAEDFSRNLTQAKLRLARRAPRNPWQS